MMGVPGLGLEHFAERTGTAEYCLPEVLESLFWPGTFPATDHAVAE